MKKFIFWFIAFIVILGAVILWKTSLKTSTDTKYFDADIRALIVQGYENMYGTDNVSYEFENDVAITKHYLKGNKKKMVTLKQKDTKYTDGNLLVITDFDEEKEYLFTEKEKLAFIQKPSVSNKGSQYILGKQLKENPTSSSTARTKVEYRYVKDEELEEKDCILVEEEYFYRMDDGSYQKDSEERYFLWIEKSTGFILALGGTENGGDAVTPESFIRNISVGTVQDSDFEMPTGYKIIDKSN